MVCTLQNYIFRWLLFKLIQVVYLFFVMLSFDIFFNTALIEMAMLDHHSPVSNKICFEDFYEKIRIKQLGNIYSFLCQFLPSIQKNIDNVHVSLSVKNLFFPRREFFGTFLLEQFLVFYCMLSCIVEP